jgi:hypothetical protein
MIFMDITHLILIVYSSFGLTLMVGFRVEMTNGLMSIELLCFLESIIYIAVNFHNYRRTATTPKEMIKSYCRHGLLLDLAAASPFNFVLGALETSSPIGIVVSLRLLRLVSVARIPSLLVRVEEMFLKFSVYLTATKTILFLVYLWHWAACIWFFTNNEIEDQDRWMDYNNLVGESLTRQYLFSIYFTMNIVTSVGYGDMFGTSDNERIITCMIIITGDALFAVAFGMMASLAASKESEISLYLSELQ